MPIWFDNNRYYSDEEFLSKLDFSSSIEPHTHDFIEIVFIMQGRGIHTVDGQKFPMARGDLLVVNPGSVHSYQSKEGMRFYNIVIKPEFIERGIKGDGSIFSLLDIDNFTELRQIVEKGKSFIHFSHEERHQLENLIVWMHQEKLTRKSGSDFILRSYSNVLLTLILRKMALSLDCDSGINPELLEYIQYNCELPLTCELFAKKCSYNPSYFSRLFKQYAGVTFSQYLTECRLSRACELLSNTELPIEKVILKSGFSDRTKFFKIFSAKMGMTPLKYRKSKKQILF